MQIVLVTIRCGRWWQWWWGEALFDLPRGGTSPCQGPACKPPFSSLLFLFFFAFFTYACSWHMLGCSSAGIFYCLSLPVNQLAPWIQCIFYESNKVHRANEAMKQLGFAFFVLLRTRCSVLVERETPQQMVL